MRKRITTNLTRKILHYQRKNSVRIPAKSRVKLTNETGSGIFFWLLLREKYKVTGMFRILKGESLQTQRLAGFLLNIISHSF
jgi:hypothetical protein